MSVGAACRVTAYCFPRVYDTFWDTVDGQYKFIGKLGDESCLETQQSLFVYMCDYKIIHTIPFFSLNTYN